MASIEVRVPDLGTFKDVAVIELLVKPGDQIEVDASIATLETEKATMDVPSTVSGKVVSLHIARGGTGASRGARSGCTDCGNCCARFGTHGARRCA
jgi:pyruvate/2-oxoglutarate dehydrogenase complex dihydrolipoamide acyltransferase (E2) component